MRLGPTALLTLFIATGCGPDERPRENGGRPARSPAVLVFTRTLGYRHASIEDGVVALKSIAAERGWHIEHSEEASRFADAELETFDVVVFLNTTGDVLSEEQQTAFERFIRSGKGFVGVHAASDTEYDWPFYGELVGAYFRAHPAVQSASLSVEVEHPSTEGLPSPWTRTDEWYGFQRNPRSDVTVVLALDEASYSPGDGTMGDDHPVAWFHSFEGGRAFYTALGHTRESYQEPLFLRHLMGAVEWAAAQ